MVRSHDLRAEPMSLTPRRTFSKALISALFLAASLIGLQRPGAGKVHRHGLHHVDRAIGPVRPPASGVQAGDRHRCARGGARNRTGARQRPPRRRRRGVRPRPGRRREVRRRGLRPEAPARDVQRFRHHRPEVRSGRRSRQRRGRGTEEARGTRQRLVRVARRQERHARGRAALLEGGRRRRGHRQAGQLQGVRLRHGPGAQHRGVERRLRARPIAEPG